MARSRDIKCGVSVNGLPTGRRGLGRIQEVKLLVWHSGGTALAPSPQNVWLDVTLGLERNQGYEHTTLGCSKTVLVANTIDLGYMQKGYCYRCFDET